MSDSRLLPLFATPLIIDRLPNAEANNQALKANILAKQVTHDGVRKSNWLGWQSDIDMLAWGGPAAQALADHFLGLCNRYTSVPPGSAPSFLWYVDMWANVSPPGASNEAHVHPGSVWSAVYYVDDGRSDADDRGVGGDLVLYDPRMPAPRMLPFDLRYRQADDQAYHSLHPIPAATGQIVMFPPWVLHSVHPYQGERERISIAMNVTAIPAP